MRGTILFAVIAATACDRAAMEPLGVDNDPDSLALEGTRMSLEEAEAIERRLEYQPYDVDARIRVLGYWRDTDDARHAEHVVWLVENRPSHAILDSEWCDIVDETSLEYALVAEAWERAVATADVKPAVRSAAAAFFESAHPERSQAIFDGADPSDDEGAGQGRP
jgi:hypothetical protein